MGLLGDVGLVEARFGLFRDSVNLDTTLVHGLGRTYHGLRNHFGEHPMELLCDVGQVEARFGLFGEDVNLGAK
jgi:hypothetical protein